jgi:hypothetical protein
MKDCAFLVEAKKGKEELEGEALNDRYEDAQQDVGAVKQDARTKLRDAQKKEKGLYRKFVENPRAYGSAAVVNARLEVEKYTKALDAILTFEKEQFGE